MLRPLTTAAPAPAPLAAAAAAAVVVVVEGAAGSECSEASVSRDAVVFMAPIRR